MFLIRIEIDMVFYSHIKSETSFFFLYSAKLLRSVGDLLLGNY